METKHLKTNPDRPDLGIRIILIDCVGNYGPTLIEKIPDGVSIRQIHDQFEIRDAIEFTCGHLKSDADPEEIYLAYWKSVLDDFASDVNNANVLPWFYEEEGADAYLVTFYPTREHTVEDVIKYFVTSLGATASLIAHEASGIEEFFDYAPSYVDMFRQSCEYFKLYETYGVFVKMLPENFVEDALYCKEIQEV